jgi:dienelactone hydrolase
MHARSPFRNVSALLPAIAIALGVASSLAQAGPPSKAEDASQRRAIAGQIQKLSPNVFPAEQAKARQLGKMLARSVEARIRAAALRENRAWHEVKTLADWERFRERRLEALRASLGQFPPPPKDLRVRVTGTRTGDGYRIENLVFESRPGLAVTANLYLPARPPASMPGILLSHSHHNPKTEGELQDMGMTWARQGCTVLVMDHLGHGERRQHPFAGSRDYPGPFRVGRQDYYFRYVTGVQLDAIGESLMGWMVWDLMRGVDLLLSRPGIDKDRIVLVGAVAGGGDPAGVAAALDPRIAAVAPFNFGGPQPDYAIPPDAENDFYWFGVPGWETTRSLRLGARDGLAHWVIVGSVAPRRLIYCHEFSWERARDPAWPRLQRVFELTGAPDHLAFATGRGTLRGSPPESSHCNNVGPLHRRGIYPILQRWFAMPEPRQEYQVRRDEKELMCLTPEAIRELGVRPLHEVARELGSGRAASANRRLAALEPQARRQQLRKDWARLLGEIEPAGMPKIVLRRSEKLGSVAVEHLALEVEPDIVVPVILIVPSSAPGQRTPVVIGLAQAGKQAFLKGWSDAIAELLEGGAAVCLPDVRGVGETACGDGRGFRSEATDLSQAELMLGQTLVGSRLRDLRAVVRYLRSRPGLDAGRIALWGDSFTAPNGPSRNLAVPLDAADDIPHAEPLGGLLALLGALYEDGVRGVVVRGGLVGYDSVLAGPFCYVPHDALVPGAIAIGDVVEALAAVAPRPVRWEGPVDGLNRTVAGDGLSAAFKPAQAAYDSLGAQDHLQLVPRDGEAGGAAAWLLSALRGK